MAGKSKKKQDEAASRIVATNRKVRRLYDVVETFEAGIVLRGSEIKSIRSGKVSIAEAWVRIHDGELWLIGMHVPEYPNATYDNHEPERPRKLLLNRREIRKLQRRVTLQGATIVPLDLHFNERGFLKATIALVTGKKAHDRREDLKKRDADREMRSYKR